MGSIPRRKKELIRRLEGVDKALQDRQHQGLLRLQNRLWAEYLKVTHQEELIWFQKSRSKWLQYGDRNTRFFQMTARIKKRRKIVESIMNENGQWLTEPKQLKSEATSYFRNLFSADPGVRNPAEWPASYGILEEHDLDLIQRDFTDLEIKNAAFEMGWPESALLPDSLERGWRKCVSLG